MTAEATCIIQTPRKSGPQGLVASTTMAKCRRIQCDAASLVLEVSHSDPADPHSLEWSVLTLYTHDGYVCLRLNALEALWPIASGEMRRGHYVYTIDRAYAQGVGQDDAQAVKTALRWLEHTRFIGGGEVLIALKSPPYLLISSRRRPLGGGKHGQELLLTLELHPTDISVKGAVLARWPVWDYEFALADLLGRAEVIRDQVAATGNEDYIDVDAYDMIRWLRCDLTAPGMEILRDAYRENFMTGA